MFIGNFPIADQVDPEDVILISKDGVHLEQITAELAGLGGTGLRWWKETETEIYREYTVENLGAPKLIKIREANTGGSGYVEVDGYEWHGRYFEKDDFNAHAGYPAIDVKNKQPGIYWKDPITGEYTRMALPIYISTNLPNETEETIFTSHQDEVTQIAGVSFGGQNGGYHEMGGSLKYSKAFPYVYCGIVNMNMYGVDSFTESGDVCYGFDPYFKHYFNSISQRDAVSYGDKTTAEELSSLIDTAKGSSYEPDTSAFRQETSSAVINPFKFGKREDLPTPVPFFIAVTCRGYYPDYVEKTVDDSLVNHIFNTTGIGFLNQGDFIANSGTAGINWLTHQPSYSSIYDMEPGCYHWGVDDEKIFMPSWNGDMYGATPYMWFGVDQNWWDYDSSGNKKHTDAMVMSEENPLLYRPTSIVVDYKDSDGFVWDMILMPAVNEGAYFSNHGIVHQIDPETGDELEYTSYFMADTGTSPSHKTLEIAGEEISGLPFIGTYDHFAYVCKEDFVDINKLAKKNEARAYVHYTVFHNTTNDSYSRFRDFSESYMEAIADPEIEVVGSTTDTAFMSWYSSTGKIGEFYLRNARNILKTFLSDNGLRGFKPIESDTVIIRTDIGVEESNGFRSGYSYFENDAPVFKELVHIDPYTGDGYFKGNVYENGHKLEDTYQKVLIPGTGIRINNNIITAETEFDPAQFIEENFVSGDGIDISSTQDGQIRADLNFELTGGTASGTLVPCDVTPVSTETNKVKYKIQVDKDDLGIPVLRQGHGISISSVGNDKYLASTALDKVKVNGQEQSIQIDPESNDRYVDLTIESGGGGQTVDICKPVLDYVNRSTILSSSDFSYGNPFTAPEDGVLFLKCRGTTTVKACIRLTEDGTGSGVRFYMGTGKYRNASSDGANMIPMKKGNVAALTGVPTGIIYNESTVSGGKWYFIPYVKRANNETVYINACLDYSTQNTSIAGSDLPVITSDTYDSSITYYSFTPVSDGVLISPHGIPNNVEGFFRIFPIDSGSAMDCYHFSEVGSGYAPFEMLPVKKSQTYKIGRSSANKGGYIYFIPFETSLTDDIYSPFLDWNAAETLNLAASAGSTVPAVMPTPVITDRPGILIDNCFSSNDEQIKILVQTSDGNYELTHNNSETLHQYIQVPAYDTYNWRYTSGSGDSTPEVIFVPFKKLVNPGIDFAVENGHNLVTNKTLDLTALYNRIAALEAAVFPTT